LLASRAVLISVMAFSGSPDAPSRVRFRHALPHAFRRRGF
jgi:hypothetical protein